MEFALFNFLMASQPASGGALNFTSGKNTMIDYSLYGLDDKDVELYREQIYNLVGKSVVQVLLSNRPITKQSILAYLIKEVERQPDDYYQKLHRAAIEVIGVNGR
ncbi:hypothetical protein QZQ97_08875 [Serratia sp. root2]|uniref:hypothetical protein n=1 Tax=Serratia sp. root2 TaxID=3059676 RepID=UPI00288DA1C3|nr:hypothetical protein [Serratia sp. root2]MDT3251047.1 hypothetical protein [Serratia sp. root2]